MKTQQQFNHDYLFVRVDKHYVQVAVSEILYCRARRGGHSLIVTPEKTYLVTNPLSEIEKYLPLHLFTRIHNSYLVAIRRIKMFDRYVVTLHEPEEHFRKGYACVRELPIGSKRILQMRRPMVLLMTKRGGNIHKTQKEEMELKLEEMEMG